MTTPTAASEYSAELVVSDFLFSLSYFSLTRLKPANLYCEVVKIYIKKVETFARRQKQKDELLHVCQQQRWKSSVPIGS